jgi:hypothetical protein
VTTTAAGLDFVDLRAAPYTVRPRAMTTSLRRMRWPWALAALALVVYAIVGLYLMYHAGYAIGDAIARASSARSVVDSRDPHLAAIGFVWMPLPTFSELPFMVILSHAGYAAAAGVLSTACWGAATVPVLAAIARRLQLSTALTVFVVVTYAFNPVIVFYAANGMSEASFFFFTALACLFFVTFVQRGGVRYLGLLGLALAGAALTRFEAFPMAAVFAVGVAVQMPKGRRVAGAVTVMIPACFALAVWIILCALLLKDPLFFLQGGGINSGAGPRDSPWLPAHRTIATSLEYCVPMMLRFAPALLAVVPMTMWQEGRLLLRRRPVGLCLTVILVASLVFPGQVAYLLLSYSSYGNPRYFTAGIVMTTVAAMYLVRPRTETAGRGWKGLLVALLLAGVVTGTATLANPRIAAVEHESRAFAVIFGHDAPDPKAFALDEWRSFARALDDRLGPDDLALIDTQLGFPVTLYSRKPDHLVITQDRDFEQIVADQSVRFRYVVIAKGSSNGKTSASETFPTVINFPPPGKVWRVVDDTVVATLYELDVL